MVAVPARLQRAATRSLSQSPASSAGFAGAIRFWGRFGGGHRGPLRRSNAGFAGALGSWGRLGGAVEAPSERLLVGRFEVALSLERRHAAGAGGGHGPAVGEGLDVT